MRLTVFGATGGTGALLVEQALAAGHQVTAVARRGWPGPPHPDLRVAVADVLDPGSLRSVLDDADAVLSALGSARASRPTRVYSAGASAILATMRDLDIRRVVAVTALPIAPATQQDTLHRRLVDPVLHRFFGGAYQDMRRMELILAASDRDWTVFRPPYLRDGPTTGTCRAAVEAPLPRAWTLRRGDLAAAMLSALTDDRLVRHAVNVAA
ncbi:NAD(P)H-binding protein [Micromonospora sp. NBC_01655]|uniref:NAD(P)-dependent oxidoreductase n=1 Tax=Micromonospora sp. NBC_01655 TaxID=2975983 RepID=UPI002256CB93|nr:NAD(P)H-binding protein [Micromonospora sp. NBC_01655]MCX4472659.1 NAD(P)H-binding protein [Micromonospora sp. NBC_01655]